jgi:hypothetical protein
VIIFGTRSYLYTLAMITMVCGRCGNPAAHSLKKRLVKFTLFFVPLFPISSRYTTQCTFCGDQQRLTKEQAEQLQAQIAQPQTGQGPQAAAPQPYGQGQNPYQN